MTQDPLLSAILPLPKSQIRENLNTGKLPDLQYIDQTYAIIVFFKILF